MILAHCNHCGATFKSRFVIFAPGSHGTNIQLSDNHETCPNCGQMADTADGILNIAGDTVEFLSAPDITRQMYADFLALARKVKSNEIQDDLFVEMADAIDPRLGKAARIIRKNKRAGILVMVLLWLYMSVNFDIKLDANRLYDQVFGNPAIEYVLPDQSVDQLERNLDRDNSNPAENRPQQEKPDFHSLPAPRKQTLLVSASAIAIVAARR